MSGRSTLTWHDARGRRTGFMRDRKGRALLVSQAAWATLADRWPLLDGKPPYANPEEARAALEVMLGDPLTRGMARRALDTAERELRTTGNMGYARPVEPGTTGSQPQETS